MMTLLELLSRYTDLHKVAHTDGDEYAGPCPWCGGEDRFRVWPHDDNPRYWCRVCGRKGDAIKYLREHDRLTYRQACEQLGRSLTAPPSSPPQHRLRLPRLATAPSPTWQARAWALIEACEEAL